MRLLRRQQIQLQQRRREALETLPERGFFERMRDPREDRVGTRRVCADRLDDAFQSSGFVLILEAFKPEVRATSLGIIYALGVTIFGGFAQLIVSALWRMSGSFYAPAWYVLATAL
ncbi:hypothetical protein [Paraburkholderia sediminicola]|uniref:hypothetical protein n=1 Tax=Paraburkholderia sediminicola TaxID=458836 RepID=UPI0038BA84D0